MFCLLFVKRKHDLGSECFATFTMNFFEKSKNFEELLCRYEAVQGSKINISRNNKPQVITEYTLQSLCSSRDLYCKCRIRYGRLI